MVSLDEQNSEISRSADYSDMWYGEIQYRTSERIKHSTYILTLTYNTRIYQSNIEFAVSMAQIIKVLIERVQINILRVTYALT